MKIFKTLMYSFNQYILFAVLFNKIFNLSTINKIKEQNIYKNTQNSKDNLYLNNIDNISLESLKVLYINTLKENKELSKNIDNLNNELNKQKDYIKFNCNRLKESNVIIKSKSDFLDNEINKNTSFMQLKSQSYLKSDPLTKEMITFQIPRLTSYGSNDRNYEHFKICQPGCVVLGEDS